VVRGGYFSGNESSLVAAGRAGDDPATRDYHVIGARCARTQ
jgi:formylglycine-generating enzyme required for sulfatase activity